MGDSDSQFVFISHASSDRERVEVVARELEALGISAALSGRADPGSSRMLLLLFSEAADDAAEVGREVTDFMAGSRPLVAVRIEDLDPTGSLEAQLTSAVWLDAFEADFEDHVDAVIVRVLGVLAETLAVEDLVLRPAPPRPLPASLLLVTGMGVDTARQAVDRLEALLAEVKDELRQLDPTIVKERGPAYFECVELIDTHEDGLARARALLQQEEADIRGALELVSEARKSVEAGGLVSAVRRLRKALLHCVSERVQDGDTWDQLQDLHACVLDLQAGTPPPASAVAAPICEPPATEAAPATEEPETEINDGPEAVAESGWGVPTAEEDPETNEESKSTEEPGADKETIVEECPVPDEQPKIVEPPTGIDSSTVIEKPVLVEKLKIVEKPVVTEKTKVINKTRVVEKPVVVEKTRIVEQPLIVEKTTTAPTGQPPAVVVPDTAPPSNSAASQRPSATDESAVAAPPEERCAGTSPRRKPRSLWLAILLVIALLAVVGRYKDRIIRLASTWPGNRAPVTARTNLEIDGDVERPRVTLLTREVVTNVGSRIDLFAQVEPEDALLEWRTGGRVLEGQTNARASLQFGNPGVWSIHVVARNDRGTATCEPAQVIVDVPPSVMFFSPGTNVTIRPGTRPRFDVAVNPQLYARYDFRWRFPTTGDLPSDPRDPRSASASATWPPDLPIQAGTVTVEARCQFGSVTHRWNVSTPAEVARSSNPAATPPASEPTPGVVLQDTRALRFRRQEPKLARVSSSSIGLSRPRSYPMLSEFELIASRDRVTVRDAEGSIYLGRITEAEGKSFAFRVTGLNRVARESVSFAGRYSSGGAVARGTLVGELTRPGRRKEKLVATPVADTDPSSAFGAMMTTRDNEIAPDYSGPRFAYLGPKPPTPGSRQDAQTHFIAGLKHQRSNQLEEAIAAYGEAIKADGAYFEAQHNLALAAGEQNDFRTSARAYETALALKPDSTVARFNFASLLHQNGYHRDAAVELLTVLRAEPRNAAAHLLIANICEQHLKERTLARKHFSRVLDLAPAHPQAASIRYWLRAN